MTTDALHTLLEALADTREIVVRDMTGDDPFVAAWRTAAADAREAYAAWQLRPGRLAHAAYLAAEDQADAALASLCAGARAAHQQQRLAG